MHVRYPVATLSMVVTLLVPVSMAAQSPKPSTAGQPAKAAAGGQPAKWTTPRTPDGKPDIQGTFTFRTITPLQRPATLADKETLSPEEAAAFEKSENTRL